MSFFPTPKEAFIESIDSDVLKIKNGKSEIVNKILTLLKAFKGEPLKLIVDENVTEHDHDYFYNELTKLKIIISLLEIN